MKEFKYYMKILKIKASIFALEYKIGILIRMQLQSITESEYNSFTEQIASLRDSIEIYEDFLKTLKEYK